MPFRLFFPDEEPSSIALVATGLLLVIAFRWRKTWQTLRGLAANAAAVSRRAMGRERRCRRCRVVLGANASSTLRILQQAHANMCRM